MELIARGQPRAKLDEWGETIELRVPTGDRERVTFDLTPKSSDPAGAIGVTGQLPQQSSRILAQRDGLACMTPATPVAVGLATRPPRTPAAMKAASIPAL